MSPDSIIKEGLGGRAGETGTFETRPLAMLGRTFVALAGITGVRVTGNSPIRTSNRHLQEYRFRDVLRK